MLKRISIKLKRVIYRVGSSRAGTANISPHAQQINEEISSEFGRKHLRDDIQVGDERRLQNDRDIRGVEELDRVGAGLASVTGGLDWQIDSETLEVDDNGEDEDRGEEVGEVRQVLAVEGLFERAHLVVSGRQQVE